MDAGSTAMMMTFFESLFLLVCLHFLADFPLQGEYMAREKSPKGRPLGRMENAEAPNQEWWLIMAGHCAIHSLMAYLVTYSLWLAVFMFVTHYMIDCRRCYQQITFLMDQMAHFVIILIIATIHTATKHGYQLAI